MKISTAIRHVREGGKNVVRNGWMSFASISAISISLFILGVFMLLALNVDQLADEVEGQVEIRVYLDAAVTDAQIPSIQNDLGSLPQVMEVRFVSKEEGLELVKEKLGEENRDILEGYEGDENPLPDSFTIKVDEPQNVAAVADRIKHMYDDRETDPILDVRYGEDVVETLFKITRIVRNIGLVLVAGLAFTAMFLISNTIKITILARRREISIMKMVGATNSFIRWPFFVEGALLGIIGSLIPIVVLLVGYDSIVKAAQLELGLMMIRLIPVREIGLDLSALLLGIGVVIGVWGSTISIRKFLKV